MITELTKEQQKYLPIFRQEMFNIGVDCNRVDKETTQKIISNFYKKIHKKEPIFMYCDSPLTCNIMINIINKKVSLRDSLRDSLGASLRTSLRKSLWASLGASLGDSLWASLWASLGYSLGDPLRASLMDSRWDSRWLSLRDSLRDSLGASLGASMWTSLGDSLWASLAASLKASMRTPLRASLRASLGDSPDSLDSLRTSLRESLWDSLWASLRESLKIYDTDLWGQQDIYWIGWYKFGEYIGVKYEKEKSKLLDEWFKLSKSCMWWYPFENYCIVCDKPKQINLNDTNEYLHSYEKPAVEFRDGWCVYCIDGIRVEERLIKEPMTITIQEIEKEENAELKRIKIQVYEYHRKPGAYIKDSGAKIIHKDEVGELYKKEIGGEQEPLVMVKVKNSTVNIDGSVDEYYLRVPPDIKTARQAVAWTFNMEEKEYNPIIET